MTTDALYPKVEICDQSTAAQRLKDIYDAAAAFDGCVPSDSAFVGVIRIAGECKYIAMGFSSIGAVDPKYVDAALKEMVPTLSRVINQAALERAKK